MCAKVLLLCLIKEGVLDTCIEVNKENKEEEEMEEEEKEKEEEEEEEEERGNEELEEGR